MTLAANLVASLLIYDVRPDIPSLPLKETTSCVLLQCCNIRRGFHPSDFALVTNVYAEELTMFSIWQ